MADDETTSIIFTDDEGVQWDAREMESPGLKSMSPDRMAMPDFRNGWLLFTSAKGDRRRLAPFPPDWRVRSRQGLSALVASARPVTPTSEMSQPEPRDVQSGR